MNVSNAKFNCLVVEDDPDCAEAVAEIVAAAGGLPAICGSVAEAIDSLAQEHYDVVILDFALPDGTGQDVFHRLQERQLLPICLMLTGKPEISVAVQLTRSGLFEYLTKPLEPEKLEACIRRAALRLSQNDGDIGFPDFVGTSAASNEVRRLVKQAAANPGLTVLLTGETGVGKDVTARMIHHLSWHGRPDPPPWIPINCSALPGEIFEAELFGHEKGAFTGANHARAGLVEASGAGTLFLDEIGDVPLVQQAKLLQLLETRIYRRLGSTVSKEFQGRIIGATNRDLEADVAQGRFREDLLYRLDVFSIRLAPLRERREDIPSLSHLLLEKLASKYRRTCPHIAPEDMELLKSYGFPGNVRELRNLMERSLVQSPAAAQWLQLDPVWRRKRANRPTPSTPANRSSEIPVPSGLSQLEAQEYVLLKRTLLEEKGAVRGTAAKLGISPQALLRRLAKWPSLKP